MTKNIIKFKKKISQNILKNIENNTELRKDKGGIEIYVNNNGQVSIGVYNLNHDEVIRALSHAIYYSHERNKTYIEFE